MGKAPLPTEREGLRVVTAAEMAAIDRRAVTELGLPGLWLMENAGRGVAAETARLLREDLCRDPARALVVVCCGRGRNGGDGLVAARHLKAEGPEVIAFIAPPRESGYPQEVVENLRRAASAGVSVQTLEPRAEGTPGEDVAALDARLRSADVIIDAVLGTGSTGKPAGAAKVMIQRMMRSGRPVVALDIPSGVHPDTGYHSGVFITARLTLALGLPKRGLLAPHAQKNVGVLKVVDIGLPPELLRPAAAPGEAA